MTALAFVSYGLGGAAVDPSGGEATLTARIRALGLDVGASPYTYDDVQSIVDAILGAPALAKIILGGDSLGANNAPYIAAALLGRRKIDYMFGFQPSVWGYHSVVTENVLEALCIYNPNWFATFGLGDYPWPLAEGNTITRGARGRASIYLETEDLHPGDNDVAMQDIILADIKAIIGV